MGCVAGSAPVTTTRPSKSLSLGLWHTTQYSTRLRDPPCTLKPCEKTPWHEAHFAWSTTARRGTMAEASTLKSRTTFCIASRTVCPLIVTSRRPSMPTRQVPVPPAGMPSATVVV